MKMSLVILLICAYNVYGRVPEPRIGFGYEARVVGGEPAEPHEAPYIVSLQVYGSHFCAGSIVDANTIVTAGHCAKAVSCPRVEIVAGLHKQYDKRDTQSRKVVSCKIHEKYPGNVAPYDIALLYLEEPLEFNEYITPVALPQQEQIHTGKATLYGWGSTSTTSWPSYPTTLQTVTKPILKYKQCESALGGPGESPLHETNLCTGPLTGGVGACSGDSGGPLVQTNVDGNVELIGVVSWGYIPCGTAGRPSVYVRTSAFVDWINKNRLRFL